ncbi:hypothetical protein D2Q93_11450 [Alicyclobacillaceae bacterium I2511]|nr:hypothetical protein D2Q93_11450 [Alicyclobacillaceae bacterium I2511]
MLGERSTKYPSVEGVGTYLALYNLGVFYESIGDKVCAKTMYERSSTIGFKRAMDAFHRLLEG